MNYNIPPTDVYPQYFKAGKQRGLALQNNKL
jgi:hypothetical protein